MTSNEKPFLALKLCVMERGWRGVKRKTNPGLESEWLKSGTKLIPASSIFSPFIPFFQDKPSYFGRFRQGQRISSRVSFMEFPTLRMFLVTPDAIRFAFLVNLQKPHSLTHLYNFQKINESQFILNTKKNQIIFMPAKKIIRNRMSRIVSLRLR